METSSAWTRCRSRLKTDRVKDNFADWPALHDNCVALGAPTCVAREGSPHSGDLHASRSLPSRARFDIHLTHAYREKETPMKRGHRAVIAALLGAAVFTA